jgi:hypothetical protein
LNIFNIRDQRFECKNNIRGVSWVSQAIESYSNIDILETCGQIKLPIAQNIISRLLQQLDTIIALDYSQKLQSRKNRYSLTYECMYISGSILPLLHNDSKSAIKRNQHVYGAITIAPVIINVIYLQYKPLNKFDDNLSKKK